MSRHDGTMALWVEMLEEMGGSAGPAPSVSAPIGLMLDRAQWARPHYDPTSGREAGAVPSAPG